LGWGGHRIAAELKEGGIAEISGGTVYQIFARLGLPVRVYALKGSTWSTTTTIVRIAVWAGRHRWPASPVECSLSVVWPAFLDWSRWQPPLNRDHADCRPWPPCPGPTGNPDAANVRKWV